MSKMSELAMELDDQAVEYGLQGYQEALERGFTYEVAEDGMATLRQPLEAQEMAHKAWLEERNALLGRLEKQRETFNKLHYVEPYELLSDTIAFIKRGEI